MIARLTQNGTPPPMLAETHGTTDADPPAGTPIRLGMITPSSNTVLEPVSAAMLANVPDVSVHFARFRVVRIGLDADSDAQFAQAPMLEAAALLADARVAAICWNGTAAGWLGLDRDRALCAEITRRTGRAATSSVLALFEALRRAGLRRVGLVTPYLADLQARAIANFAAEGVQVVAERHLDLSDNLDFGAVSEARIAAMIEDVARAAPEAIVVLCTNLRGAPLVDRMERRLRIPILDSVATALWGALRAAGADPARVQGWGVQSWGRLFADWP
ncbi:MAG TPA: aspartate/glutamate racemase family protein [Acetobacteraceae bacterium]|nr:aspartate/glutamate racemase family protein [Acetobacteraceae bacterium]